MNPTVNPVVTTTLASTLGAAIGLYLEAHGIVGATPAVTFALSIGSGALTGVAHYLHRRFFPVSATPPGAVAAVAAEAAAAPSAVVKALLPLMLVLSVAGSLVGCATTPTQNEQTAVTVAVDIAAGYAIQQGTSDPVVWKARAVNFKTIALQLQTVNNGGTATLATLAADLQPMIVKLGPADVLAANALVAALQPYLTEQQTTGSNVANAQAHVALILTAVINACVAYGA